MKLTSQEIKANALIKSLEKLFRKHLRVAYGLLHKPQNNESLAAPRLYNPTKDED